MQKRKSVRRAQSPKSSNYGARSGLGSKEARKTERSLRSLNRTINRMRVGEDD